MECLPDKNGENTNGRPLTLVLLETANVARLEKRPVDGLLLERGPVTMAETREATGGLLELGDEESVALVVAASM